MEKEYLKASIDRNLKPMFNASDFIKHSAELDTDNFYKPYGWLKADKKNTSFQSWFGDLNDIYSIVKNCNEHGGFKTTVNIVDYDEDGKVLTRNHTSFDDRTDDLKRMIDSGALAHADVTLIVFKKEKDFFDESTFKEIYKLSNE